MAVLQENDELVEHHRAQIADLSRRRGAIDPTHWGVRVIQVKAPPPATPQSAAPSSVAAGQASVSVTITGTPPGLSEGWFEPGPSFPNHLTGLLSNTLTAQTIPINSITVVDPTTP